MWEEMMELQVPLAEPILRTTLAYVMLLLLIRFIGKRGLAEMSTFDIVVVFLLAEIVGGAAIGEDDSVTGSVVSAVTLVALSTGVHYMVQRSSAAAMVLQGKPATGHPRRADGRGCAPKAAHQPE